MGKKLKITEEQLKRLVSSKGQITENMEELGHESQMDELGGPMYRSKEGGFEHGHGPDNDPEHMAELVVSKMDMMINPEYLKDQNLFKEFMSSLSSKIREKYENRSEFNELPEPPSEEETMNNQVYESIKNNFKRFL
jgi:hypothetical protein